jgi:hypothetical protein
LLGLDKFDIFAVEPSVPSDEKFTVRRAKGAAERHTGLAVDVAEQSILEAIMTTIWVEKASRNDAQRGCSSPGIIY